MEEETRSVMIKKYYVCNLFAHGAVFPKSLPFLAHILLIIFIWDYSITLPLPPPANIHITYTHSLIHLWERQKCKNNNARFSFKYLFSLKVQYNHITENSGKKEIKGKEPMSHLRSHFSWACAVLELSALRSSIYFVWQFRILQFSLNWWEHFSVLLQSLHNHCLVVCRTQPILNGDIEGNRERFLSPSQHGPAPGTQPMSRAQPWFQGPLICTCPWLGGLVQWTAQSPVPGRPAVSVSALRIFLLDPWAMNHKMAVPCHFICFLISLLSLGSALKCDSCSDA